MMMAQPHAAACMEALLSPVHQRQYSGLPTKFISSSAQKGAVVSQARPRGNIAFRICSMQLRSPDQRRVSPPRRLVRGRVEKACSHNASPTCPCSRRKSLEADGSGPPGHQTTAGPAKSRRTQPSPTVHRHTSRRRQPKTVPRREMTQSPARVTALNIGKMSLFRRTASRRHDKLFQYRMASTTVRRSIQATLAAGVALVLGHCFRTVSTPSRC